MKVLRRGNDAGYLMGFTSKYISTDGARELARAVDWTRIHPQNPTTAYNLSVGRVDRVKTQLGIIITGWKWRAVRGFGERKRQPSEANHYEGVG